MPLRRKLARQAGSSEVELLSLRFAETTAVVHHVRPEAEFAAQWPSLSGQLTDRRFDSGRKDPYAI